MNRLGKVALSAPPAPLSFDMTERADRQKTPRERDGYSIACLVRVGFLSLAAAAMPVRALDLSVTSATALPGSTFNSLEVLLTNTATSTVTVSAFSFALTASSPDLTFTGAGVNTVAKPYIFAGNSLFAPAIHTKAGSVLLASDLFATPMGGVTIGPQQTIGLGRVFFSVNAAASSASVTVTIGSFPTTTLSASDASGKAIDVPVSGLSPGTITIPITQSPASAYSIASRQLTISTLTIGTATYSNLVVTVANIVTAPSGSTPTQSTCTYDVGTNQLTVPIATVGNVVYYNAVATVGSLISIGGVTGVDTYDGTYLNIPSVRVGNSIYSNVVIKPGAILGIAGGMPRAALDQYTVSSKQLLIPAVSFNGKVYTNVTITVGAIVSVNGASH